MSRILKLIGKRMVILVILCMVLLFSAVPKLEQTPGVARAISDCDAFAIEKGSLLADSERCQDPCKESVSQQPASAAKPGPLFILGDSIGEGLLGVLGSKLDSTAGWSVSGNTRVGRPLSEGITVANSNPAGLSTASTILVVLGTNNLGSSTNSADIQSLMDSLRATNQNATVYWLKVNVTRSDLAPLADPFNALLASSGATLLDNNAEISNDGVHPANYPSLAESIANQLSTGATQTTGSPGSAGVEQFFSSSSSVQDLAKLMLADNNISYWTNNGVDTRDVVVALSQGKKAYTTSNDPLAVQNREVNINANILKFILESAAGTAQEPASRKIQVNALTDKDHSSTSKHYLGLAVDLDNNGNNSPPVSVLDPIAAKYGGERNNETTHWHYTFTEGEAVDDSTAIEPVSASACCSEQGSTEVVVGDGPTDLSGFVDEYGQMAFNTGKKYGLPWEAILAQGYLESRSSKGPGLSDLAKEAFNFFGMKPGSSWTGPVWTGPTLEEYTPGELTPITSGFRSYPNAQAGFDGYGEFVTTIARYKNALNYPGNPEGYITALKDAGWATDSSYVSKNVRLQQQVVAIVGDAFPPSSEVDHDAQPPNPSGTPVDGISNLLGTNCGDTTSATSGGGTPAANKALAKSMLSDFGWDEGQFDALDKLWTRESTWNHRAINDAEGNNDLNGNKILDDNEQISETENDAFGLPQSLPGGKMKSEGEDWRSNPVTQIKWGFKYIQQRYGNPQGAWNHSESVGWY